MQVAVVYSVGVRCYTESILRRLGLVKFSSIFGSMNVKNWDSLMMCFDTNFHVLFNEENLVYTKHDPKFENHNNSWGPRTLNKLLDDVNDYHSSTIAHHDLSDENIKLHFQRGLKRLEYIKENNIPILFVDISMEFDNRVPDKRLVESIIKNGFSKFNIISIWKDGSGRVTEPTLLHSDDYHIIYEIPSQGYYAPADDYIIESAIHRHYKLDNLIKVDDVLPAGMPMSPHAISP
jgi:hypothetical protein